MEFCMVYIRIHIIPTNGMAKVLIANQVVEIIEERIPGIPGVEDVQNIVEEVLIKNGYASSQSVHSLQGETRPDKESKTILRGEGRIKAER